MYHIDRGTNININTITNANIKKNTITHMQSSTIFPVVIFVFYDYINSYMIYWYNIIYELELSVNLI